MKSHLISYYNEGDRDAAIAVVMPSIPTRAWGLADRALASVDAQTLHPIELHIAVDHGREGAAVTRQRALNAVSDEAKLIAFIDDDDTWYPNHLATLYNLVLGGADVAYSWFDGNDPFPMHRGRQWNPDDPHHITMNIMVRAELARQVGIQIHEEANPEWPGEDWRMIQHLNKLGARFVGTGEITWTYHVHDGNTSGLASRW